MPKLKLVKLTPHTVRPLKPHYTNTKNWIKIQLVTVESYTTLECQ
jgi:hypothetical protein